MTDKIVISKPGYDAPTETNPNNLVYSSDYDTLKYYTSGFVDIDLSVADVETSITHNLGYIPFFIAYLNWIPLETDFSAVPLYSAGFGSWSTLDAYATTSKIFFTVKSDVGIGITQRVVYKIFRNNTGL